MEGYMNMRDDLDENLDDLDGEPGSWNEDVHALNRVLTAYTSPLSTIIETSTEGFSLTSSHPSIASSSLYFTPLQSPHCSPHSTSSTERSPNTSRTTSKISIKPMEIKSPVEVCENSITKSQRKSPRKSFRTSYDDGECSIGIAENDLSNELGRSAKKKTSDKKGFLVANMQSRISQGVKSRKKGSYQVSGPDTVNPYQYQHSKEALKFFTHCKSHKTPTKATSPTTSKSKWYKNGENASTTSQSRNVTCLANVKPSCHHDTCIEAMRCTDIPMIIIHDTETGQQTIVSPLKVEPPIRRISRSGMARPLSTALSAPCLFSSDLGCSVGSMDSSGDLYFRASEPNIHAITKDDLDDLYMQPCDDNVHRDAHNQQIKQSKPSCNISTHHQEIPVHHQSAPNSILCNCGTTAPVFHSSASNILKEQHVSYITDSISTIATASPVHPTQGPKDRQTSLLDVTDEIGINITGSVKWRISPGKFVKNLFKNMDRPTKETADEDIFQDESVQYRCHRENIYLVTLAAAYFILGVAMSVLGPLLLHIGDTYEQSISTTGTLLTIRGGGITGGFVLTRLMLHRWNSKLLLSTTLFISAGAHIGLAYLTSYSYVMIVMGVQGVTVGILLSAVAILCYHHLNKYHVLYTQIVHSLFGIGMSLAPVITQHSLLQSEAATDGSGEPQPSEESVSKDAATDGSGEPQPSEESVSKDEEPDHMEHFTYTIIMALMVVLALVFLLQWAILDKWSLKSTVRLVRTTPPLKTPNNMFKRMKTKPTPKLLFSILAVIHFFASGFEIAYPSFLTCYITLIQGWRHQPVTMVTTLFLQYIFYTLGRAVGGLILHHVISKRVTLAASVLITVSAVLELTIGGITELVLRFSAIMTGFCLGIIVPSTIVWVGCYLNRSSSGFLILASCLGFTVVPGVSGWVLDKHGLTGYDWYKVGVAGILCVLCIAMWLVWALTCEKNESETMQEIDCDENNNEKITICDVLESRKPNNARHSSVLTHPVKRKKGKILHQYLHSSQYYMTGYTSLFIGYFENIDDE